MLLLGWADIERSSSVDDVIGENNILQSSISLLRSMDRVQKASSHYCTEAKLDSEISGLMLQP